MTSKLQLTLPKNIADQYGIRPGDELQWTAAGEVIRVTPTRNQQTNKLLTLKERLRLFDRSTQRQRRRQAQLSRSSSADLKTADRGWKREDLYQRGFTH